LSRQPAVVAGFDRRMPKKSAAQFGERQANPRAQASFPMGSSQQHRGLAIAAIARAAG